MLSKNYIAILLVLFCAEITAFSQIIHYSSMPLGIESKKEISDSYKLNVSELEIKELRTRAINKNAPFQFAISREVSLLPSNSGYIKEISDSESIWYLNISDKEALSINIIFNSFKLAEGESLFLYNSDMSSILGPLTALNNKPSGILATMPISGNKLIIEYHFNPASKGDLEVGKISADILGVFAAENTSKDWYYGSSGLCNIDINCPEASLWQLEKRSVVRILAGGNLLGTAVLLNNSNQENIAYALTALHVAEDQADAQNSLFIFRYESPWCDGPDGTTIYSLSGADMVAQNSEMDFSLLRLSEFPPILYKPYLAGWKASSTIASSTVCIHHPGGDVKKYSIDNDAPQVDTFKDYYPNGFWRILQWDLGTTEEGSSGAPLFDQDHFVIGYLSGGEAMCGRSVNDYFARFDMAYELSADINKSLRPWLDPAVSGCAYLVGRDPYAENFSISDTLYNGSDSNYSFSEYIDPGTGLSTGINSDSILAYAEKFSITGKMDLTEVYLYVAKSNYQNLSDNVTIRLHNDDMGPGEVIAAKSLSLTDVKDDYLLALDFGDPVTVSGDIWISYTNTYYMPASTEIRQFALYKEDNMAMGSEYAWFRDELGWKPFSQHPFDPGDISLAINIVCVSNSVVNPVEKLQIEDAKITIYPVPFVSELYIDSDTRIETIELLDFKGLILARYNVSQSSGISIQTPGNLDSGIYFLRFNGENRSWVRRIIKGTNR